MRLVPALIGATLAAVLAVPGAAAAQGRGGPVVKTEHGAVQGVRAPGVESFLGIRYAAPPVGALRWRPPQPAARWPGIAPATAYGARCAAAASSNGARTEAEDCLFVNVQRPAGLRTGERRPVYVFIHGGGLVNGSSNQADMAALVRATGVIGVSFNYRLGVLGFLGLPGLTAEGAESGNYGFQDQQAALRVDPAQRRGVRRRPGADHRRRRVGGRLVGVRAPRRARLPGAVQPGDDPERVVLSAARRQQAETSGTRARHGGGLHQRGVPAKHLGGPADRRAVRRLRAGPRHAHAAGRPGRGGRDRRLRPGAGGHRREPRRGPDLRAGLHRRDPRAVRGLGRPERRRAGARALSRGRPPPTGSPPRT